MTRVTNATKKANVQLKRAYERPSSDDGIRILVDRLWPRGVRKSEAAIDRWIKEIAPSAELRRWFDHDPARWNEFRRRYRAELSQNQVLLKELRSLARRGSLTLVYGARDEIHNQAVVLRNVLIRGAASAGQGRRKDSCYGKLQVSDHDGRTEGAF